MRTTLGTCALALWSLAQPTRAATTRVFDLATAADVVAVVHAGCDRCDWGAAGREAVALRMAVDGVYSQHIVLVRGAAIADYPVTLGTLAAGSHRITIDRDESLSASDAGTASVERVDVRVLTATQSDDWRAQTMAPILFARANTIGHFTDVPILMWYEIVPTPRGRQFRYSVIFTNEDGGTATDRLMATWGRTTDIEFVYGAELDASGALVAEEFQGPDHQLTAFRGRHEARHPLLLVATDNNMVSDSGSTSVRYAPAPERADLTGVSREVLMDRHPWSYRIASLEMLREHKIVESAEAGSGLIADPRRFAVVEACVDLENAAVAFSLQAGDGSAARWFDSDRGRPEFRVVRTGCFRGAVPLPAGSSPTAMRFRAFSPPPRRDGGPTPPGSVRLTRVTQVFVLDDNYQPRQTKMSWTGSLVLPIDGDWQIVR